MTPEQQHIAIAIERYVVGATIPILYDALDAVDQVGTGTLFGLAGRHFLITARHTFDNRDPGKFAIPKSRVAGDLHSLGPLQFIAADSNEADVDLAILELLDAFTIGYAKSGWKSLTLDDIAPPPSGGTFVLCGYPSQFAARKDDLIKGKPATTITYRIPIPASAKPPVNSALDLFFQYDNGATTLDGAPVSVPHLGGVSGSSVWHYQEPENATIWTPGTSLRAVGVETSFVAGNFFRAKSWQMVLEMLRGFDADLGNAIDRRNASVQSAAGAASPNENSTGQSQN